MSFYGIKDFSLLPMAFALAPMHQRAAGFPEGGSAVFAKGIEKRFLDLGGKLVLGSRVERMVEEDGRAVGIVANGREVPADDVVSAMDMKTTLERLLGGRRGDETHRVLFESGSLMDPAIQVSMGVAMDLSNDTDAMGEVLELPAPVRMGGCEEASIAYRHYSFDPSFAPPGKSVVSVFSVADWAFWDRLRHDRAAYQAEKANALEICIDALERRFPGFRSKVERTDVATPLTFERYCGNWKGVYMTWNLDGGVRKKYGHIRKTVPGSRTSGLPRCGRTRPAGYQAPPSQGETSSNYFAHRTRSVFKRASLPANNPALSPQRIARRGGGVPRDGLTSTSKLVPSARRRQATSVSKCWRLSVRSDGQRTGAPSMAPCA